MDEGEDGDDLVVPGTGPNDISVAVPLEEAGRGELREMDVVEFDRNHLDIVALGLPPQFGHVPRGGLLEPTQDRTSMPMAQHVEHLIQRGRSTCRPFGRRSDGHGGVPFDGLAKG